MGITGNIPAGRRAIDRCHRRRGNDDPQARRQHPSRTDAYPVCSMS